MQADAPKDNANPIIHDIEEDVGITKKRPLGWSQLEVLHVIPPMIKFDDDDDDDENNSNTKKYDITAYSKSAADQAVAHALMDAWEVSHGQSVELLRSAGVGIPKYSHNNSNSAIHKNAITSNGIPHFIPTSIKTMQLLEHQTELDRIQHKRDSITSDEIFDIIRNIQDPEHAGVTLEQLRVVSRAQIDVHDDDPFDENDHDDDDDDHHHHNDDHEEDHDHVDVRTVLPFVTVRFTPTIPHCSMATLIGLSIRVKLMRSLSPQKFKLKVYIEPGTHNTEDAVNKQLDDKERVAAALENTHLLGIVDKCIREGMAIQ